MDARPGNFYLHFPREQSRRVWRDIDYGWGFLALMLLGSCKGDKEVYVWKSLEVDVSAYNSVPSQTDRLPNLAAWGDTLKPGMKCIAVSRDLIGMGLDHDTQVRIHGLEGIYVREGQDAPQMEK